MSVENEFETLAAIIRDTDWYYHHADDYRAFVNGMMEAHKTRRKCIDYVAEHPERRAEINRLLRKHGTVPL